MQPFRYVQALDEGQAAREAQGSPRPAFIAGGTTLVDLMRLEVARPTTLIDLNALALHAVEARGDGLRIGALVRNSDLAYHPLVRPRYALLADALLAGASAQIRNMATVGGNLLQRTRCTYFRDQASPCNKRSPGSGCSAIDGYSRMHAILGGSDHCIAVHPSDMCVALVALDASIRVRATTGAVRDVPIEEFHHVPGMHPEIETGLQPGELVTHVDLPGQPESLRASYVKVRDRASFAFALAAAAVTVVLEGETIRFARVALGGVATKPWRSREAEHELVGKSATPDVFRAAVSAAFASAVPRRDNAFKVELAKRTLLRALSDAVVRA